MDSNKLGIIFGLIGGLGLFFYGFHVSGKALQNVASFSFRKSLEKLTKNVFFSLLVGFFITAMVQSSSATTVFLVNFINAGLISLTNSIGIIFGANIGTTVTVQFIAFNLDQYVFPAIALGAILKLFFDKKAIKVTGEILLGFGLIFLGIVVMKNAMTPLKDSGVFLQMISSVTGTGFKSIVLGFAISAITAALIHSSGATLAIVIALAYTGVFTDIRQIIPLIIGAKIGTCVTAFLASIRGNRDSKRVALAHFMFNIIEAAITFSFIGYFSSLIQLSSDNLIRQIANAHMASSIVAAVLCLPFTKLFVSLLYFFIPVLRDEKDNPHLFDVKLLETPGIAIESVKKSLLKMGDTISEMLKRSCDGITESKYDTTANVFRMEAQIDQIRLHSFDYIMELSKKELTGFQALKLNAYREITNDFERIADHVENIVENALYKKRVKCELDKVSADTVKRFRDHIMKQFHDVYTALDNEDPELATQILMNSKKDEKTMYKHNTVVVNQRIKQGEVHPEVGMLLVDVTYNFQRMSYHMRRVLYTILRINQRYDDEKALQIDES